MRIAVVGGGPAGLYFARLMGRSQPQNIIDLFERGVEGATWGFGIGLAGRAMAEIAASDPPVHARLAEAMRFDRMQIITLNDASFTLTHAEATGTIARLNLLEILTSACREVGVRLHFGKSVEGAQDLSGYDLVVAADGAASELRTMQEEGFGTDRRLLTNRFAWYGVGHAMPTGLSFRSRDGGNFVAHHYAYAEDQSTFVAECDQATWARFGLEDLGDEKRRSLFESVFAQELKGSQLLTNRSIWRRFPAITNRRFHHDRTVLIGDSLRVAHFSIGSGTRLAMEDAAALHNALVEQPLDIGIALRLYEKIRRPGRDGFGEAARLSFEWYERMAEHMQRPILPFIHGFLTRTGRVSDDRLKTYAPNFYEAYANYLTSAVH